MQQNRFARRSWAGPSEYTTTPPQKQPKQTKTPSVALGLMRFGAFSSSFSSLASVQSLLYTWVVVRPLQLVFPTGGRLAARLLPWLPVLCLARPAYAALPQAADVQAPQIGDHALR